MKKGASPFQKNKKGESVDDYMTLLNQDRVMELKESRGADIFLEKSTSLDGKEFRCKNHAF
jgi:hypothetical protein